MNGPERYREMIEQNRDAIELWKRGVLAQWDAARCGPVKRPSWRGRLSWKVYDLRLRLAFWIAPDDSIEAS